MRRTRMSICCPLCPRYSPSKPTFEIGRFVRVAAIAAVRQTDVTEYVVGIAASLRLDASKLDDLGPLLGFVRD